MIYSEKEVQEATLSFFRGDELASKVWISKYALKNEKGELMEKTPDDMFKRHAREIYRIERKHRDSLSEELIFSLLKDFKYFVPAGSAMYGIGNPYSISSLANCFVAGNDSDSYGGIMSVDQDLVQLMKRRGGVGTDISHYRPKKSIVSNSAGSSTGAVSFMERFSNSTREVAQDGRRGACMLSMHIAHPDIEDFISIKGDKSKVTGANISIRITDEFMKAVNENASYALRYPVDSVYYQEEKGSNKWLSVSTKYPKQKVMVKAKKIWDKIIDQAWSSAEPGVLFWDTITRESPSDCYSSKGFETKSTNPCGEQPLSYYDSCRLGALNLYSYVKNPFTDKAEFDFDLFSTHVIWATRIMDDMIDLEIEKIDNILRKIKEDDEPMLIKFHEKKMWEKVKKKALDGRRIGLGITALADMLAALGLKYGTKKATEFSVKVIKTMSIASYKSSIILAEQRGAFPIWNQDFEKDNPFINRILNSMEGDSVVNSYKRYGRRNIQNLTIAPTGSLSILTQTTSGLEPVFMTSYIRRRKVDANDPKATFKDVKGDYFEENEVFHHKLLEYRNISKNDDLGPYVDASANEINYLEKVEMQGLIQKWIDSSISITHNLPSDITKEKVSDIYLKAWESGCKGCTIYRDGSRDGVLISKNTEITEDFKSHTAVKRPKELECEIHTPKIKGQQYVVAVGLYSGKPYEVFAFKFDDKFDLKSGFIKKVKKGRYDILNELKETYSEDISSDMTFIEEDRTRLISTSLRHGADIKYVVEQLSKSKGELHDFSKVIARVLKKYIHDGEESTESCPECNEKLIFTSGCMQCNSCGYSKCS